MKVIGLTGGIGAGKSMVASLLKKELLAVVIDTDSLGHEVIRKGQMAYEKIVETFGTKILDKAGEIDRRQLAAVVFSDSEKLNVLNALVHPAVREQVLREIAKHRASGDVDFVFVETALILEAGYQEFCDEIWYVKASEEIRTKRLMENRGYSKEKIQAILSNQKKEKEFLFAADFVICNETGEEDIKRQVTRYLTEGMYGHH